MTTQTAPLAEVKGRTAFITGGSSGIGLGLARACSAAGMKVAFTWRRADHRNAGHGGMHGVDGIEPLTGATQMALKMRDDVVTDGGYPDKILANAPQRAGDFYAVPKVVE